VAVSRRVGEKSDVSELTLDLFGPGMTALHRVGLAGLAMSLQRLENDPQAANLRARGSWVVTDRTISVSWRGEGKDFFSLLLAQSFRVTDKGLIWFAALGDPLEHPGQAVVLHKALLDTFLQHPQSTGRAAKALMSTVVDVDGIPMTMSYLPLRWYAHQRAAFDPSKVFRVAGWVYPGGVVRHRQAEAETSITDEPPRALALLYAPIGALFFQVHRQAAGVRPRYCLLLPDVRDLLGYGEARQLFLRQGVSKLQVAGPADAAARVLAELATYAVLGAVGVDQCTVTAFGATP